MVNTIYREKKQYIWFSALFNGLMYNMVWITLYFIIAIVMNIILLQFFSIQNNAVLYLYPIVHLCKNFCRMDSQW